MRQINKIAGAKIRIAGANIFKQGAYGRTMGVKKAPNYGGNNQEKIYFVVKTMLVYG
jgi:hypothetical protein